MADLTAQVRKPGLSGEAPNRVAVSASDVFDAAPDASYILHYVNGATTTGAAVFTVVDPTTPIPEGSAAVPGFADAEIFDGTLDADEERYVRISNTNRFRDANGQITLEHTGTLTTVTLAILGPYPAGG